MFWDGNHWVEDGVKKASPTPTRRKARDWFSTGIMGLALVALVVPMVGASAATYSPRVTLSSDIGPAGSQTTLSLSGFAGNTSGQIAFDGSTAGMPAYTTASDGSASVPVTIPLNATVADHKIATRNALGVALSTRTFTVNATADGAPAPTPTPTPTPAPISSATAAATPTATPTPTPTPAATGTYDAVFAGDATGATDVTSALRTFLQNNNGKRVALAPNGIYRVTQLSFTASNLTIDFRGAQLQGSLVGAVGIFRIRTSSNVTVNDPRIQGTGYAWSSSYQGEHGIYVDGGSNITLNRPVTRNTRGDGIYIGFQSATNQPARGVVINQPNIEFASRNGISPVAGEVTIRGGHIYRVGLHGVDFEPNSDAGAGSIVGIVDAVDIRRHGDLPGTGSSGYAVAAGGYSTATKPSIVVQNLTGDYLRMTIRNTSKAVVRDNVSDANATVDFPGSVSITFSGNVRIARI